MAKTVFSEYNETRWVGVRPGVVGEQITKDDKVIGATATLYEVPANKVLLITSVNMSACWTGGGAVVATLYLQDAVPVTQHKFADLTAQQVTGSVAFGYGLPFPVEALAGWFIKITSGGAAMRANGGFTGILIDA